MKPADPSLPRFVVPTLIDPDTPSSALTRTGYDNEPYTLVFSDEFNTPGRTFYPGDDPFWEAADLWYWTTNDTEWYDPRQVTTANGSLVITMEEVQVGEVVGSEDNGKAWDGTEGLPYRSGMLQSWNKVCFFFVVWGMGCGWMVDEMRLVLLYEWVCRG